MGNNDYGYDDENDDDDDNVVDDNEWRELERLSEWGELRERYEATE